MLKDEMKALVTTGQMINGEKKKVTYDPLYREIVICTGAKLRSLCDSGTFPVTSIYFR